jgi:hypothetical protein
MSKLCKGPKVGYYQADSSALISPIVKKIIMKKTFFIFMILPAILFIGESAYASRTSIDFRPGHIVTTGNDTVFGLIDINTSIIDRCVFRLTPDSGVTVYNPDEIREFRIDGAKYFVSNKITVNEEEKQLFLEYLLHGIVNLYFINIDNQDYYFVEKEGIIHPLSNERKTVTRPDISSTAPGEATLKTYQVRSAPYQGLLTWLFQDAPEVLPLVQNTQFNHRSLIKLTSDYHNMVCDDFDCIDFTRSTRLEMYISTKTGMTNAWFSFVGHDGAIHDMAMMAGFNIRLVHVQFPRGLSLLTGLDYARRLSFTGEVYSMRLGGKPWYLSDINYDVIKIPVIVQYNFGGGRVQPLASIGYNNLLLVNKDCNLLKPGYHPDDPPTHLYSGYSTYQMGLAAGFGLNYRLDYRRNIILKTDVEYMMPFIHSKEKLERQQTISSLLTLGYEIKL